LTFVLKVLSFHIGSQIMAHGLTGKIAVVIGGTTGIAFANAKRIAAEGARVFITGRSFGPPHEPRRITGQDVAVVNAGPISAINTFLDPTGA
jgi:NAD(P)-dependent dehydrogenase (short-subunit alcohol dehydrogenase family)